MNLDSVISALRSLENSQRNLDMERWYQKSSDTDLYREVDANFKSIHGSKKLRITYVMNHVRVCGGSKIIIEHTNWLINRGHDVSIVCHFPRPDWIDVKAQYIEVPFQMNIAQMIPESDIIITTVYDQIIDCYLSKKAPIIHFEQGDTYIYDFDQFNKELQETWKKHYKIPVPMLAVSSGLAGAIKKNFGRDAAVLNNALDPKFFYPRVYQSDKGMNRPRILFVGPEQAPFKGIQDIRAALDIVRKSGWDFEPVWVTPVEPDSHFEGTLIVNPSQTELGDVYRTCDIYVSGSYYESFPLPPLEAMSCGCAVVSTNNVGVYEYGSDGQNCLLANIQDPQSLANAIIELLEDKEKKMRLVQGGYETAAKFNWDDIITKLEMYMYTQIVSVDNNEVIAIAQSSHNHSNLRIETLRKGMLHQEALDYIIESQLSMDEEWCLWLIEGETIDDRSLNELQEMMTEPTSKVFSVQVLYENDIPEHPLVRTECRLLRRGELPNSFDKGQRLPIRIIGGSEAYFLPKWLSDARRLYSNQQYSDIIDLLKNSFSQASQTEQAVIIKWISLALIEMQSFAQVVAVLKDAIQVQSFNSDLLYLYGRIAVIFEDINTSETMLKLGSTIGDAYLFPECFIDMKEHCKMYVLN